MLWPLYFHCHAHNHNVAKVTTVCDCMALFVSGGWAADHRTQRPTVVFVDAEMINYSFCRRIGELFGHAQLWFLAIEQVLRSVLRPAKKVHSSIMGK